MAEPQLVEIAMVEPQLVEFPSDGDPLLRVLNYTFPRPRRLYLSGFSFIVVMVFLRYVFLAVDPRIIVYWNFVDSLVGLYFLIHLLVVLAYGYHQIPKPLADASHVTHVLTILVYKEPEHMLYSLVDDLARQESAGTKVLLIGMERNTPNQEGKMEEIRKRVGSSFAKILYTVHDLKAGEIASSSANIFNCQVVAASVFEDRSNVIFTKLDTNSRVSGPMLFEIEQKWCRIDASKRRGVFFVPNVRWTAPEADRDRIIPETGGSLMLNMFISVMPFGMSVVIGSLQDMVDVGYTPPGLLSEDSLLPLKFKVALPNPQMVRLSHAVTVAKLWYPRDMRWFAFLKNIGAPKLERWFTGLIESIAYFIMWCTCGIQDHPPARKTMKTTDGLIHFLFDVARLYQISCGTNILLGVILVITGNAAIAAETFPTELLTVSVMTTVAVTLLSLVCAGWVTVKLYSAFDFLKFSLLTWINANHGVVIISIWLPWLLLWTWLKHGVQNKAIAHVSTGDLVPEVKEGEMNTAQEAVQYGAECGRSSSQSSLGHVKTSESFYSV